MQRHSIRSCAGARGIVAVRAWSLTLAAVVLLGSASPASPDDVGVGRGPTKMASADLRLSMSADNTSPELNDDVVVTLVVVNDGPDTATGIVVEQANGFFSVSDDGGTQGTTSPIFGGVRWVVGSLSSGASATLVVTHTVGSTATHRLTAEVMASDQADPDSTPGNGVGNPEDDTARVQITALEADLSVGLAVNNSTPLEGSEVAFTATISNAGPGQATGVRVAAALPTGLEFVSASGGTVASQDASIASFEPFSLASGASHQITLTLRVLNTGTYTLGVGITESDQRDPDSSNEGPIENFDTPTDDGAAALALTPSAVPDLEMDISVDDPTPLAGEEVRFTVEVANRGNGSANSIKARIVLPDGYGYVSDTGIATIESGGVITWPIATLGASGSEVLYVDAVVHETGSHKVTAQVMAQAPDDYDSTADNDDGDQSEDDEASVSVTPIPVADLSLFKSVDEPAPRVGEQVVFTVVASNAGPSGATGVEVTDPLPSGYAYVSDNGGSSTTELAGEVTWTVGSLAAGSSSSLEIVAAVLASGEYANAVEITAADQFDGDSTPGDGVASQDDYATVSVAPVPVVDLSLSLAVDEPFPVEGSTVVFTATVANAGPSGATGITARHDLPAGYTYLTHNGGTQGSLLESAGTTTWFVGELAAGAQASLLIYASVNAIGPYKSTAEVTETFELDLDSQPDNDDGNQSQDDEASATVSPIPAGMADLGDAPIASQSGFAGDYPTRFLDEGAHHLLGSGNYLGACVDGESNGQPSADAGATSGGDDADVGGELTGDCATAGDDEDGVAFLSSLLVSTTTAVLAAVEVSGIGGGFLSAWIDLNRDGDWADAGEQLLVDEAVVDETRVVTFSVPPGSATGQTFARFRFSSASGLGPNGRAPDGEVEDYAVDLVAEGGDVQVAIPASSVGTTRMYCDLGAAPKSGVAGGSIVIEDGNGNVLLRAPMGSMRSLALVGSVGGDQVEIDLTGDCVPASGLLIEGGSGDDVVTVLIPPGSSTTGRVRVAGGGGDDTLVLDLQGGYGWMGAGLTFDGGTGADDIILNPGGAPIVLDSVTHTFANNTDGAIRLSHGGQAFDLDYTGLEPIADNLSVADRTFSFSGVSETVSLTDNGDPTDGLLFVDSDIGGESVTFAYPTTSLRVDLGAGDDLLAFTGLDEIGAFPSLAVVLEGGEGEDQFDIAPSVLHALDVSGGANTTCPGDVLNFTGGTIAAGLTPGSGVVSFVEAGLKPVSFSGIELLGQATVDLAVAMQHQGSVAWPGDRISVELLLTNAGPNDAGCVTVDVSGLASVLEIDVDDSTSELNPVASAGQFDKATGRWSLAVLPNAGSETLSIPAVVNSNQGGQFESIALASTPNQDSDAANDHVVASLSVRAPFQFPKNAHATAGAFAEDAGLINRLLLGLYQGAPGVSGSVLCRFPAPDGDVFTATLLGPWFRTCSANLPYPLVVNQIWRDPDGTNAGRVYLATWGAAGLYYTDDLAGAWTAVEPALGEGSTGWVNVYSIAEDATDGILYISANNGKVFRSLNSGAVWQEVGALPQGSSDTAIALAGHPANAGTLFAGTFGRGVYQSVDYGRSWTETTGNGALVGGQAGHVFDLLVLPDPGAAPIDYYLFAATANGVWRQELTAGVPTWTEVDPAMAGGVRPEIRGLTLGPDGSADGEPDLFAASWGLGVFRMATPISGGALTQFGLRTGNVTMLAADHAGVLALTLEGAGLEEMDAMSHSVDAWQADAIPSHFVLEQNYPNPFNPVTTIRYGLPQATRVRIALWDLLGRQVRVLVDAEREPGVFEIRLDAGQLPSGQYLYRMEADGMVVSRLLTLLK